MKKIVTALLLGSLVGTSLFALEQKSLKEDISRIFTGGKVDAKSISIIAQESVSDLKDLHVAIGSINGSTKPFLLLYNKDTIIVGSIKDRKSGKSVFDDFISKNRDEIQKSISKLENKNKNKNVLNNKKIISLLDGEYKESMFVIKGGNPKGKIIYLITDPNCPYCQQYEKNELPNTIKNSKEVRVVPLFLNIPGHESSAMRASWLLEKSKNSKDMYRLMRKASNSSDMTYKEVDENFAKAKIKKMKKFLDKGLIPGTPTIFDENGIATR